MPYSLRTTLGGLALSVVNMVGGTHAQEADAGGCFVGNQEVNVAVVVVVGPPSVLPPPPTICSYQSPMILHVNMADLECHLLPIDPGDLTVSGSRLGSSLALQLPPCVQRAPINPPLSVNRGQQPPHIITCCPSLGLH